MYGIDRGHGGVRVEVVLVEVGEERKCALPTRRLCAVGPLQARIRSEPLKRTVPVHLASGDRRPAPEVELVLALPLDFDSGQPVCNRRETRVIVRAAEVQTVETEEGLRGGE